MASFLLQSLISHLEQLLRMFKMIFIYAFFLLLATCVALDVEEMAGTLHWTHGGEVDSLIVGSHTKFVLDSELVVRGHIIVMPGKASVDQLHFATLAHHVRGFEVSRF